MKKVVLTFIVAFLFCVPPVIVLMQDDEIPPDVSLEITGVDSSQLPTAVITANVFDRFGQFVSGLTAENFTLGGDLAEFAELVSVENITDNNLPISTVLAIDTSSSMSGAPLERAKDAARVFVNNIGADDPVAIIAFSNQARLVQDYTTDTDALLAAIDRLSPQGQTALYDASLDAVLRATESPVPRRAVILLSDGAESDGLGGVLSIASRESAQTRAVNEGIPVYTIGLGFGVDRTFLQGLAETTNTRFYESPSPDQLPEIYNELAGLLRTQYVITYNVNVPLDGTEYGFTLQADTPLGVSNEASATLRAPVPVPVIRFIDPPTEPISEPTTIIVSVLADDDLQSVTRDETVIELAEDNTFSFEIDPLALPPGITSTTVTAVDVDGDSAFSTLDYEIAALPATINIGTDLTGLTLTEPQDITFDIGGQTAPTDVSVTIGDETTTLTESPYTVTLDPATLQPGEQTVSVEVTNAGGVSTTADFPVTIGALPPQIILSGIEDGAIFEGSFLPSDSVTVDVDVDSQTAVTEVVYALDGMDIATQSEPPFSLDLAPLEVGAGARSLAVTVTNAGGASATESVSFTITIIPTPTPTPTVDFQATADAQATSDTLAIQQTATSETVATLDAEATLNTVSTENAVATADAQSTLDIQATQDANATATQFALDVQATITQEAIETSTQAAVNIQRTENVQATATQDAIDNATATQDAQSTATQDTIDMATQNAEATTTAQAQVTQTQSAIDQATADARATATEDALEIRQTQNARATQDMQIVENAQATTEAREQLNALETLDAQATADRATATQEAIERATQGAIDMQATRDAEATDEANATATQDAINAQATLDAEATEEANATATQDTIDAQATRNAEATEEANATATQDAIDAQATRNAEATEEANATATQNAIDAQATLDAEAEATREEVTAMAQAAINQQATEDARPTATATDVPTETDAPTATDAPTEVAAVQDPTDASTATDEPTATDNPTATDEPTAEITEEPTPTPTQEIAEATDAPITATPVTITEEIEAQDAPEDDDPLPVIAILICGLLLVIMVVFFVLRRRRNE